MGVYINIGNDGFVSARRSEYVDKSGLIAYVNSTLSTEQRFSCVTRCRRFGKSLAAKMLCAYYDHSCDSRHLFADLAIASHPSFEEHLNKYPVIYLDMTEFVSRFNDESIVEYIDAELKGDIIKAYPDVMIDGKDDFMACLIRIYEATGQKFIFIIDEWDSICREDFAGTPVMDHYVNWLRRMFKGVNGIRVFAGVYMTGILPIKRYGTQSALNNFQEFSMANADMLAGYIGFTEPEVRNLCAKYDMDYEEMKAWYDGYSFSTDYSAVFNPNSVIQACKRHKYNNYWGKTSSFETLQLYIDMNQTGVQENLEKIVRGECLKVSVLRFGFDVSSIGSDDELFTLLIHLGFLSYNVEEGTVRIPNKEIRMEFIEALRGSKTHKKLSAMVRRSDRLMKATLDGDEQQVAEIVGQIHDSDAAPSFYNNEQALRSVLKLGYLSAIDDFVSIQELPTGRGYADLAFIPRLGGGKPAVVVELKWNKTEHAAIDQIKNRDYPNALKRFTDNILLVGINYDETTKKHTCKIERL